MPGVFRAYVEEFETQLGIRWTNSQWMHGTFPPNGDRWNLHNENGDEFTAACRELVRENSRKFSSRKLKKIRRCARNFTQRLLVISPCEHMKTMWIQLQIQTCFLQALRLKTAFEFAWQKDKRRCPVFSLPNSWPLGVFTKFYISIRGWYQWPFQATRERFFSSSLVRSLISPKFIERLGNSPRSYVLSCSFETQECMLVGRIFFATCTKLLHVLPE